MEAWGRRCNYHDFGYCFSYRDIKNRFLGARYWLYAHFDFYFLQRALMVSIGQGLANNTNAYHPEDNYANNAFGSSEMPGWRPEILWYNDLTSFTEANKMIMNPLGSLQGEIRSTGLVIVKNRPQSCG